MARPVVRKIAPPALDDPIQREFQKSGIPYRLQFLDAAEKLKFPTDTPETSAVFEAAANSGRLLLEFLGLKTERGQLAANHDYKVTDGETDDVKAPDVGGAFVDPKALDEYEAEVLAAFHVGACKACAHFTWDSGHRLDARLLLKAIPIIRRLVQSHVPNIGK